MDFTIRYAAIDDINQIYEIEKECFDEIERLEKNVFYYHLLNNSEEIFLIAEKKSKHEKSLIIGFIIAFLNSNKNYEIITINISEKYRKKGIATELMLKLEKEIQNKLEDILKIKEILIELVVYEHNFSAINLYKKLGYKNIEFIPNYYTGTKNGIKMIKKIIL